MAAGLWLAVRGLDGEKSKQRLEIFHLIITTAAIFVGAVWVWDEFSRERQGVPRLTTTETVTSLPVPDDQELLDVRTVLTNAGKTRVVVQGGFTRVQQVLPLDQSVDRTINPARFGDQENRRNIRKAVSPSKFGVIAWPTLCKHIWNRTFVLEPGENQEVNEQFLHPRSTDVVRIYTYLVSPGDNSLGYEIGALHTLDKKGATQNADATMGNSGGRLLCSIDEQSSDQPGAKSAIASGSR